MERMTLLAGTANPVLAAALARELGVELGGCEVRRFPDGEVDVRLTASVRRREVFVVQPTCPPVNDHLVELLAVADACRRSAAARVVAVVPYYGYARSDKRHGRREPITASLVAGLMEAAGIDHVLTVDLHTTQIEGFFRVPVDTLSAVPVLCEALRDRVPADAVVVAPDAGRVALATEYADLLDRPLVVLHKRRESGTETRVTHIVGEVRGRACVLVDDMISTGGTIVESVGALRDAGARPDFTVVATHGLLLRDAAARLAAAGVGTLVVTDTVPPAPSPPPGLHVVSVAPILADFIRRTAAETRDAG
ncbi:MAG: prs 1 [Gemmatimonadetes bacterium]|nr:prs 1 [Gemmatimonadota bacterium]